MHILITASRRSISYAVNVNGYTFRGSNCHFHMPSFSTGAGEGEGGSHFLIEKICYSERYNDFFKSRLPFGRAYSFRAANKKS